LKSRDKKERDKERNIRKQNESNVTNKERREANGSTRLTSETNKLGNK
jgi:hypothetical protein